MNIIDTFYLIRNELKLTSTILDLGESGGPALKEGEEGLSPVA